MNDKTLTEINDRVRRIETKLSRYIAGEDDLGITKIDYTLVEKPDCKELHLHTMNVTLKQMLVILEKEGITDEVDVIDDGRYELTIVL